MWFLNGSFKYIKTSECQFEGVDVLKSDEMRQGIKKYTDWPTIPQLYVKSLLVVVTLLKRCLKN